MWRYIIVSIGSGILFGIMDGTINVNPLAQRLNQAYAPILKKSINPIAGIGIDLAYGFIMAAVFVLLYQSLPGQTGIVKGLSFGVTIWFFRVVMSAASTWVMFTVPANTILYNLVADLGEMLALGILYGLTLRPG
ncbi:MAG: hypothetical protein HZB19_11350 [Chloroflexi bacterium]|nr:hypothetical protein [Chloroflexota bacterium]